MLVLQQHQQDLEGLNVTNDLNDVLMCSENSVKLIVSLSGRSGLVRSTKQIEDKNIQTDPCISDQPKLRINHWICIDKI